MEFYCEHCNIRQKGQPSIDQCPNEFYCILRESRELFYQYNFKTNQYDFLSPSVRSFTGYDPQEMSEFGIDYLFESLHPDDKDIFMTLYNKLKNNLLKKSEIQIEYRTRHADGRYVWRDENIRTVRNPDGQIVGIIGIARDITEHKKTLEELKASEERFKRLAEVTFEGIAIHDSGKILDANRQFLDMFGYCYDELINKDGLSLIISPHRQEVQDHINSEYERTYTAMGLRKNGSTFPIEVQAKHIQIDGKKVRIALVRDLTEQQKLQRQLAESEKRYRELYDNAQLPLFRTRISDGKLLACNQAMANFAGYQTIEECLAHYHSTDQHVDPDQRKLMIDKLLKEKRIENYELEGRNKDNSSVWIQITAQAFPEQGYIEGAITDITASKILTKTEIKVLKRVLEGKTNKEIADEMDRSIRTIEDHRQHIMQKMDAHNLVELTKKALTLHAKF